MTSLVGDHIRRNQHAVDPPLNLKLQARWWRLLRVPIALYSHEDLEDSTENDTIGNKWD